MPIKLFFMKKYIIFSGIVSVIIFLAPGCKKDTPVIPPVNAIARFLASDTAKTWIDFYRSGIKSDSSHYVIKKPCFTDDNWIFKAGGDFEMNEGASKCKDTDPYVFTTGNWKLSADNKFLEFSNVIGAGLKSGFKYEIIEITDDKLSLKIASKDMYVSTTAIEEDHLLIAK